MTPEELIGRLSNQRVSCEHSMKARQLTLCKECKEGKDKKGDKPYTVFLYCLKDDCDHSHEDCGYFWGPGNERLMGKPMYPDEKPWPKAVKEYSGASVRMSIAPKYEGYYAKLAIGQSPTWRCDQRTKDIFCLQQWISEELTALGCPDEDRRFILNYFNRKARAEDDLYVLAAKAVNSFLTNTIERYRGR